MTVAIRQIIVPRLHRQIHQWQVVRIVVELIDISYTAVETWLTMPDNRVPLLSLYDPSGVLLLDYEPMIYESAGHYSIAYQTTNLSPLGVYTASIVALDIGVDSRYARLEKMPVFKIIKESTLPPFPITYTSPILSSLVAYYKLDDVVTPITISTEDVIAYYKLDDLLT